MYADSTAVLGPLATYAEPHCYDLCAIHAGRLTVPRGWNVLRLEIPDAPRVAPDELSALADAVSERPGTPGRENAAPPSDAAETADEDHRTWGQALTPPEDAGVDGTPQPGEKPRLRMLREPNQ
ncbi:hypothetical protein GCM10008096_22590 [Zhihengliuella salsuginis]|uniref:DUF3499 domain-containing protein n=1 Tax=Zhihengliuella salsuginis TaxID=578222 RepID=A0ABQ3GIX8_9MICC|nr:hypothetical protein GCM10008096_22590 [Zhihengliuella salsuginis]